MDEKLQRILRDRIGAERGRRKRPAAHRLSGLSAQYPGGMRHSRYAMEVSRVAAEELDARVALWLQTVGDVFSRVGQPWTDAVARTAQVILEEAIRADFEELVGLVQNLVNSMKTGGDLTNAHDRAPARIRAELDLLVYAEEQHRTPLGDQLQSPRYESVRRAWMKGKNLSESPSPDYANAAKEMVGAVEQLARLISGRPTATLGEAIRELRSSQVVRAPLLKGVEELWGWASSEDGVRHGAESGALDVAAARKVVRDSESVISFLLEIDMT